MSCGTIQVYSEKQTSKKTKTNKKSGKKFKLTLAESVFLPFGGFSLIIDLVSSVCHLEKSYPLRC